jgi:hypothetical protein
MGKYARLATAALALGTTGFGYQQSGVLSCQGSFGRFADGHLTAMPSQLTFVIDWQIPAITTDMGRPGRITVLTSREIAFEVQYESYTASYRISRIDGSISQTSNYGGVFHGSCDLQPLETRF